MAVVTCVYGRPIGKTVMFTLQRYNCNVQKVFIGWTILFSHISQHAALHKVDMRHALVYSKYMSWPYIYTSRI